MMSLERIALLAARGARDSAEHDELVDLVHRYDEGEMMEFALKNHVLHVVGEGLRQEGCLAQDGKWTRALVENERTKSELFSVLERAMASLARAGITAAVIESAGVAALTGMPLASLGSGDADVLVEKGTLPDAMRVLATMGFEPTRRAARAQTSRVELVSEGSAARIEIGEVVFERKWTPLPFSSREGSWLRRARPSAAHPRLRTLQHDDLLVQVATHTSMHSFVRAPGLRLHVDVDRVVRACEIDWSHVVAEALRLGASTRVWLSSCMACALLSTPIPETVLEEMRPTSMRAGAALALIERHGVFVTEARKLPPAEAIALDALLEDGSVGRWLARNALPSQTWLHEQFGHRGEVGKSRLRLQLRRIAAAVQRWNPQ